METHDKHPAFRVLILITSPKLVDKATGLYHAGAVPIHYRLNGMGTASSEMLDLLGIGSSDKGILISMMPKPFADKMLYKLQKELRFEAPGNGIAFTLPLSGVSSHILNMLSQYNGNNLEEPARKDDTTMSDIKHVLIAAIVNPGYSEEMMPDLRAVGARGGTILHSRRMGDEEAMSFWGLSLQEEKEIIMIVAKSENKMPIMQTISEKYGLHSEAQGIVLSLPIDLAIGLSE